MNKEPTINEMLAKLYKCSHTSGDILGPKVAEARVALGIPKGQRLTPEQKLAVFNYHKQKFKYQKPDDGPFKLVNFSIKLPDRRTVISLERYYVEALQTKFKLESNTEIRQWIESVIAGNVDQDQPITKQIKRIIVMALTNDN